MNRTLNTSMAQKSAGDNYFPAIKTILLACLVAGTMDALAAIIMYGPVFGKLSVMRLFQGIARGAFGRKAFEGGSEMAVYGVIIHYTIAFIFSTIYFFAFAWLPFLRINRIVSAILYGLFVWIIMNLVVLPAVGIAFRFNATANAIGIIILMICIGIPVSFIVSRYYKLRVES